MQQPSSQAANAVMGQFAQQQQQSAGGPMLPTPSSVGYPLASISLAPHFLQSTANFDLSNSSVDSFAQYHQINLYPPPGMPPSELPPPHNGMPPMGQSSPQPIGGLVGIGQFPANEITQKSAQNGIAGPGRPPKQRDKSDKEAGGPMENGGGRKMDANMERGPTENGLHGEGANVLNSAETNSGPLNVPSSSSICAPLPQNHFIYGSTGAVGPGGFGQFDPVTGMGPPEYSTIGGGWSGILPTSYPQLGHPSHQGPTGPMAAGPPACIGPDEMGGTLGLYAPNGLMGTLSGQLPYELEPMAGGGYGVWPSGAAAGGYYMGTEQQAKLLADGQYIGGPIGQNGGILPSDQFPGPASGAAAFYGSLQPLSGSLDASTFPAAISTLPPPPSQLASSDQLFGIQNGFPSLCSPQMEQPPLNGLTQIGQPPPNPGHPNPSALYPPPPTQQSAELFGGGAMAQLAGQNGGSGDVAKFGNANSALPPSQHCNARPGPSQQAVKKSTTTKAHLRGAMALGRPSTSAGQNLAERGGRGGDNASPPEKRKSRSRSVVKESEDDENMTEEREAERRNANNTRERIRVRDINAAFKELARLCCQHMPNVEERSLTKLGTLLKAVELIPLLEKRVEEKNRNIVGGARQECLKQRLEAAGPSPSSAATMPPSMMLPSGMGGPPPMGALSPAFAPLAIHPSAGILGLGPGPSGLHHPHAQQQSTSAGGGGGLFD